MLTVGLAVPSGLWSAVMRVGSSDVLMADRSETRRAATMAATTVETNAVSMD